jgi:hypothetical protein
LSRPPSRCSPGAPGREYRARNPPADDRHRGQRQGRTSASAAAPPTARPPTAPTTPTTGPAPETTTPGTPQRPAPPPDQPTDSPRADQGDRSSAVHRPPAPATTRSRWRLEKTDGSCTEGPGDHRDHHPTAMGQPSKDPS